jgi:hypothetical protein
MLKQTNMTEIMCPILKDNCGVEKSGTRSCQYGSVDLDLGGPIVTPKRKERDEEISGFK